LSIKSALSSGASSTAIARQLQMKRDPVRQIKDGERGGALLAVNLVLKQLVAREHCVDPVDQHA
jgi:hypothetical protein